MAILRYTVAERDDGRILKRVIRSEMGVSAHLLASAKAQGAITVNGEIRYADRKVFAGDVIEIAMEDRGEAPEPQEGPVDIVFMDDDIIIVNKPAPLPSVSSPRQSIETLENRMAHYFRDEPNYTYRPVNRLDKGTSGLMVIARHQHAQNRMQALLHTDAFIRTYRAVVEGIPDPVSGTIDRPIGKADGATVKRVIDPVNGKPSVTIYETERTGNGRALVRIRLMTGRTHQIRVHMSSIGHPVTGDFLYGTEIPELPGRFALHSSGIDLIHPMTGEKLHFETPLPDELKRLLDIRPLPQGCLR